MRCASVTLLLCLATVMLAQVSCQISGRSKCLCLKTSKRVLRKENIESYMIQKAGSCHIDAVLFKTFSGNFVCADPEKPWVKRAIEYVDNRKKTAVVTSRPINSESTSTQNNTSNWNTTAQTMTA